MHEFFDRTGVMDGQGQSEGLASRSVLRGSRRPIVGKGGSVLGYAGMRSWTVVDEEWFQGKDDTTQYSLVKVHRHGLSKFVEPDLVS